VEESVAIALLALVPAVIVPTAMFLDTRREHLRIRSEIAGLEEELDRLSWDGTPPQRP
jgi:hypothetical protein